MANFDFMKDDDFEFESKFSPVQMRCLALVSHNHMKESMQQFVIAHKNTLKKFRLTGTNSTMTMLGEVFGKDPDVVFGPSCTSGPLGGDAELCALMCLEDLGGVFFFQDPLSAHPHQADIDCLNRLANVHNVILCPNPSTAHAMSLLLRCAIMKGDKGMIPSFFFTLESPAVASYKAEQKAVTEQRIAAHAAQMQNKSITLESDVETDDENEDEDKFEEQSAVRKPEEHRRAVLKKVVGKVKFKLGAIRKHMSSSIYESSIDKMDESRIKYWKR